MRKLSDREIKQSLPSADELAGRKRYPISVVVENIRSMYNVGSIFRTSDAACIQELVLCGYTARPPRKEIDKTALGATETVPWRHIADPCEAIHWFKERQIPVIVLEHCDRSEPLTAMQPDFPMALVLGNEVTGISEEVVALADAACEIPMYGIKQSLNVAVAYGVAVFTLLEKFQSTNATSA